MYVVFYLCSTDMFDRCQDIYAFYGEFEPMVSLESSLSNPMIIV